MEGYFSIMVDAVNEIFPRVMKVCNIIVSVRRCAC